MNLIDVLVFVTLVAAFPIGLYIFGGKRMTWSGLMAMCDKYRWQLLVLAIVYVLKSSMVHLERAMERYATDYTLMIYGFEGNAVFWVQHYLESYPLTVFMVMIYIISFLFIMVFSLAFFSYMDMRKIASKLGFLYLLMFFLMVPFYLFVIVYVPSYPKMLYPDAESVITGMDPLLYNFGPRVNEFFMNYETFNNCFPSLHIGYPAAILMLIHFNVRGFRGYKCFLLAMIILTAISIVYLGIHWLTDIAGGLLFAVVGVMLTEKYAHRFWKRVCRFDGRMRRRFKWWRMERLFGD